MAHPLIPAVAGVPTRTAGLKGGVQLSPEEYAEDVQSDAEALATSQEQAREAYLTKAQEADEAAQEQREATTEARAAAEEPPEEPEPPPEEES